uniref:Protein kinase domain-containing protein n=1 Tax=Ascaris lumbricoides TaxID=6252 RepID=A0A0M3I886_ASCLU
MSLIDIPENKKHLRSKVVALSDGIAAQFSACVLKRASVCCCHSSVTNWIARSDPMTTTASNVDTIASVSLKNTATTLSSGATKRLTDKEKDSEPECGGAEEVLEESPCRRWSKRGEEVNQRDVPGIDSAYLAMDNDTGNEVVWNEVLFSERKDLRAQEVKTYVFDQRSRQLSSWAAKINAVFDNLAHLVHPNLVKFHKYWTDSRSEKPRIVFITEYMSSGSLARFLQRTRKSGSSLSLKAWKKWTTQILSALNYLHSCNPPIVHANLSCSTIFIQHNGLVKIGCVAPSAIHHHVKTFRQDIKNLHYVAPEYQHCTAAAPSADIYSFGICALEMFDANVFFKMASPLGLGGCSANGSTEATIVTPEMIEKALDSIKDPMQKGFIASCLNADPQKRPTSRNLLFHTVLFEVHSLKLLAAHRVVASKLNDSLNEDRLRVKNPGLVAATSKFREMAFCQVPAFQVDLEKFLDDVSNGIYPLTAFAPLAHQPRLASSASSLASDALSGNESLPEESPTRYTESRSIVKSNISLSGSLLTITLKLDDSMNRQLTTEICDSDAASNLVADLVRHGLISAADETMLTTALEKTLQKERCCADSTLSKLSGT